MVVSNLCISANFYVPGFKANAKYIIYRIADVYITEVNQTFEFVGCSKRFREVFCTPASNADIEITNSVKRVAWWCE